MVEAQLHIIKKQLYLVYCIIVLARIIVVVIFFLPENDSNSTVLFIHRKKEIYHVYIHSSGRSGGCLWGNRLGGCSWKLRWGDLLFLKCLKSDCID